MLGAVVFAAATGDAVTELWWPLLALAWGAPLLVVALHRQRAQGPVAVAVAVLVGLPALALTPFGYGLFQLPAALAMVLAASQRAYR